MRRRWMWTRLTFFFQPPGSLNSSFDFLCLFQVMSQRQEDQEVQVRFIHPHLYLMYKYSWTFQTLWISTVDIPESHLVNGFLRVDRETRVGNSGGYPRVCLHDQS